MLESLDGTRSDGRVHLIRDGQAALSFLLREGAYADRVSDPAPRLVLLELDLPKVSGLEVLRAIKANDRLRAIPVVMFASSTRERDIAQSYLLGANSYVQKPGDFHHFREVVRRVCLYWVETNQPHPVLPAADREG